MNEENILDPEQIIELLFRIIPYVKVSYHIPGKIKFHFVLSELMTIQGIDLQLLINEIPGIIKTRFSLFFSYVVIEYDHKQFPYDLWECLIRLGEKPEEAPTVRSRLQALFSIESL